MIVTGIPAPTSVSPSGVALSLLYSVAGAETTREVARDAWELVLGLSCRAVKSCYKTHTVVRWAGIPSTIPA